MSKRCLLKNKKGFTLLELMIVIGLMVIFAMLTIPYGMNFYRSRVVEEQSRTISNILARAQSHAITGKEDSNWGVRFFHDTDEYVFFKGARYSERDIVYDQVLRRDLLMGKRKKKHVEKTLKVASFPQRDEYVPSVRVAGKWLKALGFALGDEVVLVATEGKILITKKEGSDNGRSLV